MIGLCFGLFGFGWLVVCQIGFGLILVYLVLSFGWVVGLGLTGWLRCGFDCGCC